MKILLLLLSLAHAGSPPLLEEWTPAAIQVAKELGLRIKVDFAYAPDSPVLVLDTLLEELEGTGAPSMAEVQRYNRILEVLNSGAALPLSTQDKEDFDFALTLRDEGPRRAGETLERALDRFSAASPDLDRETTDLILHCFKFRQRILPLATQMPLLAITLGMTTMSDRRQVNVSRLHEFTKSALKAYARDESPQRCEAPFLPKYN